MLTEDFAEEKEVFQRHIQRAGLKRTAQRDLILEVFLRTEEHLSSEDLYRLVQAIDPDIGQTTVYRTLKLLKDAGLAREARFGDGLTRYEHNYKHPHHDHMICTECGKYIEFYSAELEGLQDSVASEHNFTITHHTLRMWGICAECQPVAAVAGERAGSIHEEATAEPRVRLSSSGHALK